MQIHHGRPSSGITLRVARAVVLASELVELRRPVTSLMVTA